MTKNMKALLSRLINGYYLVRCSSGWALWKTSIHWSQGRTPNNAIKKKDFITLLEKGYLLMINEMVGEVILTEKGRIIATKYNKDDFIAANEGYKGKPFE